MLRHARWVFIPAMLLAWLVVAGPALARGFPVNDEADLFKNETVRKADQIIRNINERFHKDVLVETMAKTPSGDPRDYFSSYGKQRVRDKKVDGIYLLINHAKNPRDNVLEIFVDDKTGQTFTQVDRRELREKILAQFKKNDYNQGLLDGLQFIEGKMNANPPVVASRPKKAAVAAAVPPAPHVAENDGRLPIVGWVCLGLVAVVVIWLIFGMIRAFTAPRGGYMGGPGGGPGGGGAGGPGYGYGGGGGGGGFMSGMLGGMFGAVAGNWLYNNLGGGHGWGASQAYGNPPDAGPGATPDAAGDRDYSETGGTWGNDSGDQAGGDQGGGDQGGGGDWGGGGGGDAGGGGDWGGGGGGGGDFGGGGGDFGGGGGGGGDW